MWDVAVLSKFAEVIGFGEAEVEVQVKPREVQNSMTRQCVSGQCVPHMLDLRRYTAYSSSTTYAGINFDSIGPSFVILATIGPEDTRHVSKGDGRYNFFEVDRGNGLL